MHSLQLNICSGESTVVASDENFQCSSRSLLKGDVSSYIDFYILNNVLIQLQKFQCVRSNAMKSGE